MKTKLLLLLLLPVFCPINRVPAASFTNLDFESVRRPIQFLDPPSNQLIASSQAFPGWTVSMGGVPQSQCLYNATTLGAGSVDLFSAFPPQNGPTDGHDLISGNYTAFLQTGGLGLAELTQTGNIPSDSRTLLFNTYFGDIQVSLDGLLVPVITLGHTSTGQFSGYDSVGVDVSALAGKDVKLSFFSPNTYASAALDDIRFSPVALVPEPSTWAMFGLGLAALLWKARRSNRP